MDKELKELVVELRDKQEALEGMKQRILDLENKILFLGLKNPESGHLFLKVDKAKLFKSFNL